MEITMDTSQTTKRKKLTAGLALIAVSAVIVGTVALTPAQSTHASTPMPKQSTPQVSTTTTQMTPAPATATASPAYTNGTYNATGQYFSPGGKETLKVQLTLNDDIVTASSVVSGANDPTAESYQTIFISGYKSHVIGKKISSIKLTNVSGSSLTSQGFNNALKQIEQQAKA
jgi:uncharacterized protein with FMN-binding domain